MAHNSLPNNLTEVCNGIINFIKKNGEITVEELMNDIPGPDFPLGGEIINIKDVKTAFKTGKSSVSLKVRGDYEIDKNKIIFTSIPYRTYRNKIKEQINKNIEELENVIIDFDDESNVGKNRLVFTVKDEASIKVALNKLFSLTDLQTTLSYNMNFIVNGTPKLCSLYDLISNYVRHRENILLKATEFDKEKAEARLHILLGLIIAIDKIDEVIALIKNSLNKEDARMKIINLLGIDTIQAEAVLNMKLSKLTKLDKNELIQEKEEKERLIAEYNKIINSKEYRNTILISQVESLKNGYGDARRTKLTNIAETPKEDKEIEFVEPEKCVVVMTEGGLIKRIPSSSFRTQKRNGKGVKTQDDITSATIRTNTIDSLMIFTNKGKMYRLLVNDIPVGTNTTKGQPVKSLVSMDYDEIPQVIYSIYRDTDAKYVLFTTKKGLIKKTPLTDYLKTKKKAGIAAITVKEDDKLVSVSLIKDEPLVILTTGGMGIKINSTDIPISSRIAMGVKAINLKDEDSVLITLPIRNDTDDIALIAESGVGKKIKLNELVIQRRGGKGIAVYKPTKSTGDVKAATLISDEDNVLICGETNSIFISAQEIPLLSRISIGNQILKGSKVKSISKV